MTFIGRFAMPTNRYEIQNAYDVNVTPGADGDDYALTWDNSTSRFVLAGALKADSLTLKYDGSNNAAFTVDSSGNLTITPSGRGVTAKVMHVGDVGVSGSNLEVLSVQRSYTSTEVSTYAPNMFEGHAKWIGTADAPTGFMRGGYILAQGWSSKSIESMTGLAVSTGTFAATQVIGGVYGIMASATMSYAGSSAPIGYGVYATAGAISGSMTEAIGIAGRAAVPEAAGSGSTAAGVLGEITSYGGSLTTAIAVEAKLDDVAGTIGSFFGFGLNNLPATPTITNAYGLYLPAITIGKTLNYAIFASGGQSYFGGNVGIGTATPASRLDLGAGALTLAEMSAPTGAANTATLYTRDSGAGKTLLCCKLGGDVEIVIATQA